MPGTDTVPQTAKLGPHTLGAGQARRRAAGVFAGAAPISIPADVAYVGLSVLIVVGLWFWRYRLVYRAARCSNF